MKAATAGDDRGTPPDPPWSGRHRQDGILPEEEREGVEIGTLPGVHEPSEQPLLADLGHDSTGGIGTAPGFEASTKGAARALERAVHARDRAADRFRHLRRAPREHVAEDQHGSLPRRKELHHRDEGEGDAFLRVEARGWVGRIVQEPIGVGLEMLDRRDRWWASGPFI